MTHAGFIFDEVVAFLFRLGCFIVVFYLSQNYFFSYKPKGYTWGFVLFIIICVLSSLWFLNPDFYIDAISGDIKNFNSYVIISMIVIIAALTGAWYGKNRKNNKSAETRI
jgi:hypothetical protein